MNLAGSEQPLICKSESVQLADTPLASTALHILSAPILLSSPTFILEYVVEA